MILVSTFPEAAPSYKDVGRLQYFLPFLSIAILFASSFWFPFILQCHQSQLSIIVLGALFSMSLFRFENFFWGDSLCKRILTTYPSQLIWFFVMNETCSGSWNSSQSSTFFLYSLFSQTGPYIIPEYLSFNSFLFLKRN